MEVIFEKLAVTDFVLELFISVDLKSFYCFLQIPCLGIFEDNFSVHLFFVMHAVGAFGGSTALKPEGRGFDSRCRHWNFLFV
jgi:hypothetical protein